MTSLADKVARVKELDVLCSVENDYYNARAIANIAPSVITQLWDENQKQREVLERIAKGQNEQGISDLARHLRAMAQDCLTAIDNVMNK